jgi:protein gp37
VATKSAIEWTETTWNPVTGCDRVAAGCDNCYALALSKRLKAMGVAKYQNDGDPRTSGPGFGVTTHPKSLAEPYGWSGSRLVFVNSMSDLSVGEALDPQHRSAVHRHCLCARQLSRTAQIGLGK